MARKGKMGVNIEASEGLLIGRYDDDWSECPKSLNVDSGDKVQLGLNRTTTSVMVESGSLTSIVQVMEGSMALNIRTFGWVSRVPNREGKTPEYVYELRSDKSGIRVTPLDKFGGLELVITNHPSINDFSRKERR